MAEAQVPSRSGRVKLLLLTVVVVGLVGVIAYLAGQLNAHRYYLVRDERALVVYRGASIPFVTKPFVPINEIERTAYAPIPLPLRWDGPARQSFDDRGELDRGIYAIIDKRLRDEFYSGRGPAMERVDADMRRVQSLSGLSDDDRKALTELQGDYAYLQAREIVDGLPDRLRQARRLCDQAEDQGTGKLGNPRELSTRLGQWMRLLAPDGALLPVVPAAPVAPAPVEPALPPLAPLPPAAQPATPEAAPAAPVAPPAAPPAAPVTP